MDNARDQSDKDAPKAISPMSRELRETWGIQRSMITQREGAGDTVADPAGQWPHSLSLQPSRRWLTCAEQVGELSTAWRRGRQDAAASLEVCREPASCPVTPVLCTSERHSVRGPEAKSGPAPESQCEKGWPSSSKRARAWDEQGHVPNSNSCVLEGLQNRLPRKPEREPTEAGLRGFRGHLRKQRCWEEDPSGTAEVKAHSASHSVPPCEQDTNTRAAWKAAAQAAKEGRECESEAATVQGPKDKAPGDRGRPPPERLGYAPSTLHCVCCQPPSNRMMMHCDGDYVGTAETQGRLWQRSGDSHLCLDCTAPQVQGKRTSGPTGEQAPGCRPGGAHDTEFESRAMDEQTSGAAQGSEGGPEGSSSHSAEKATGMSLPVTVSPDTVPCAGPGCRSMAQPGKVYCGNECILKHAAAAVRFLSAQKGHKPKPKKVKMKPEELHLPKPSVQGGITMASVHKRPAPEETGSPVKKVVVIPRGDTLGKEAASKSSIPSWAHDHKASAGVPEKTAAPSPLHWGKSPEDPRRADRAVGAGPGSENTALSGSLVGEPPLSRSLLLKKQHPFANLGGAKLDMNKSALGFRGHIPKRPCLWEAPAGTSVATQEGPMPVPLAMESKQPLCSVALMGAGRRPGVTLVPTAAAAPGCLRAAGPALSQPESPIHHNPRCSLKEILWKRWAVLL
ncbi:death-inducer obliterator 1-like [Octodon degus]|uniref:Death-inducer obliterator 1-like n=1 Tax=Octodon degus TaxID=10160 RepID=A0A6P6DT62_OCTDE|nr:death-inducer obliterator 1-like [Octodon degus]